MKLATCRHGGRQLVGVVDGGRLIPLEPPSPRRRLTMLDVIAQLDSSELRQCVEAAGDRTLALGEVILEAPLPRPRRNIFCIGKNYRAHAEEFDQSLISRAVSETVDSTAQVPIVFTKPPEAVIGPEEAISWPTELTSCLDYEAELAIVIGRPGRAIRREDASRHVFGYTIINDITARDLQYRHQQWFLGKALDASCPMGPWIVTADEIASRPLHLRCWVNGELRQEATTADLIFDIPTLIVTISAVTGLQAGDVIATGTPAGVGIGFDPPRYLADGDTIDIEISGIGRLSNTVQQDRRGRFASNSQPVAAENAL